ncbi:MAG: hypothetical protein ABSE66_07390 [Thermoplasmata archaeon]
MLRAAVRLMGGIGAVRSGRRYRRARRLRSGKRGVVAVIGTLLALLVFFALFGIFLTQYVPLWMTDNEAQFTNAAATSFAQFKGGVDTQYALGIPQILGTPFTVSSGAVPLIAQPTEGILDFLPQTCPGGFYALGISGASVANYGQPVNPSFCVFENQTMSVGPGGSGPFYQVAATGVLNMVLPNRYYPSEMFSFENDGVVQIQSGSHQIMAVSPPFNVTRLAGNVSVTSSFLQQYGNTTSVIAQGSEEVYSHLRYSQQVTSNGKAGASFNYLFEVGTQYPCAWSTFLQAQMNATGLPKMLSPGVGVQSYNFTNPVTHFATIPVTGGCYSPTSATTLLVVNLHAINYANLFYAGVEVVVGIGGV